jgi:hypothetical protein
MPECRPQDGRWWRCRWRGGRRASRWRAPTQKRGGARGAGRRPGEGGPQRASGRGSSSGTGRLCGCCAGQGDERTGHRVHANGGQLRMFQLVRPQPADALVGSSLDLLPVGFTGLQAKKGVVVRGPASLGQTEPLTDEVGALLLVGHHLPLLRSGFIIAAARIFATSAGIRCSGTPRERRSCVSSSLADGGRGGVGRRREPSWSLGC